MYIANTRIKQLIKDTVECELKDLSLNERVIIVRALQEAYDLGKKEAFIYASYHLKVLSEEWDLYKK